MCKIKNFLLEKFYEKYFFFFHEISEKNNFCENFEKKLLRLVVCCVKLQKRVNADFHKIQYFYFSRICVKLKISYLRNFMRNIFVFFQKISEENNFCENFEKKTFEACCVLCKTAKTR